MSDYTDQERIDEMQFQSISDFKWSVHCGAEICFEYHNKDFGVYSKLQKTPDSPIQICVCQVNIEDSRSTELWCDTPDEALEYLIDGKRLREIITEVEVYDRTI